MADENLITTIGIAVTSETKQAEKGMDRVAKKLEDVKEKSTQASGSLEKANQKIKDTGKATKQTTSALKEADKELDEHRKKWDKINSSVSGAISKMNKGILKKGLGGLGGLGKMGMALATSPWKRFASSVATATKKLSGFFAALKRIAIYRAIRAALKEITQGFREGMQNLYQYSLLIDGKFAKSMDMLATSALYAKNSLGAMSAPIVNVLAPAVDYLTDRFVELLNVINQFIAVMTGASTWTRALKYPKAYEEALDGASGKAKELRKTLLSFDEINRLDDNNKGSRGRAEELLDYSKMFEEAEVNSGVAKWIDKVKEAYKKADFSEIGASIGLGLKNALENINWESLKSTVERNAKSLTSLINGFVNVPKLGATVGYSIAQAINVAVAKIDTFFSTIDWDAIGRFIGDGVNKFVDTFDIVRLAHSFTSAINGGVRMLSSFIDDVNWTKVGDFIGDGINSFFEGIDAKKLATTIGNGILGACKAAVAGLKKIDFLLIGSKIMEFFKSIPWSLLFVSLVSLIGNALLGALKMVAGFITSDPAAALGVAAAIAGIIALKIAATSFISTIATAIAGAIASALGTSTVTTALGSITTAAATAAAAGGAGSIVGGATTAGALANGATATRVIGGGVVAGVATTAALGYGILKGIESIEEQSQVGDVTLGRTVKDILGLSPQSTYSAAGNRPEVIDAMKKDLERRSKGNTLNAGGGNYYTPYANGGTVATGDLFLANESGPELVASVGHKTQVANQDQIVGAIEQATMNGNAEGNALLRQAVGVLTQLLNKDTTVVAEITTDSITNGLARQNLRNGRTTVAVGG